MKSDKGITLTSLIIYVIVFTTVIATVSTLSGYLSKNINSVITSSNSSEQYTKLTTYLMSDLNSTINLLSVSVENNNCINIQFVDGAFHRYLCYDNKIYYFSEAKKDDGKIELQKKIILCENVDEYSFKYEDNKLKISITIDGITYNNTYSIEI